MHGTMHACMHTSIHPSTHSLHTCNDVQLLITSRMPPPAQGGQNLIRGHVDAERCQPFALAQGDEAARMTKLLLCDEHSCPQRQISPCSDIPRLLSSHETHRTINFQQHFEARCCSTTQLTSLQPGTTLCTIQLVNGMNATA